MENKYLLSTLVKAKQVLDLVQTKKVITLKEVERELDISKTTAFRLLYSLTELNYLVKDGKKYTLAPSLLEPDNLQTINWTVVPILKPIVDYSHLSVYVGIVFTNKIVISQVIPTEEHFEDYSRLGESLPLNTTAMGKCALAFLSPDEQEKLFLQNNFIAKTKNTLTDPFSLVQALKIIHGQGYAIDDEEKELDFRCIAVPLFKDKKLIAVIGLSGTLTELRRRNIKKLVKVLKEKSKEIELTLLG